MKKTGFMFVSYLFATSHSNAGRELEKAVAPLERLATERVSIISSVDAPASFAVFTLFKIQVGESNAIPNFPFSFLQRVMTRWRESPGKSARSVLC